MIEALKSRDEKYRVLVYWSSVSDCFVADLQRDEGGAEQEDWVWSASSEGDTPEDAVAELSGPQM